MVLQCRRGWHMWPRRLWRRRTYFLPQSTTSWWTSISPAKVSRYPNIYLNFLHMCAHTFFSEVTAIHCVAFSRLLQSTSIHRRSRLQSNCNALPVLFNSTGRWKILMGQETSFQTCRIVFRTRVLTAIGLVDKCPCLRIFASSLVHTEANLT